MFVLIFNPNGRKQILSDLIPTGDMQKDKIIIPKIIELTRNEHDINATKMSELIEYYYNRNIPIRSKTKIQQPSINNQIGVSYANIAVTQINGYCFANQFTFSNRNVTKQDQLKYFNDSLDDDNYLAKTLKMTLNAGITGFGYKYIVPATDEEIAKKIYYRTIADFNPLNTYCVYSNDLENTKIMAVNFIDKKFYDENYRCVATRTVYTVWTKWHKWEFYRAFGKWVNSKFNLGSETETIESDAYPLPYEIIPVIENIRKADRTNDFEIGLDLINAINALASARLDSVQQNVDYIILLRDIDIASDGALAKVTDAIKQGLMSFKSAQGALVQPNISVLDTKLNQSEIQTLQDFLCGKLEEVLNIPNRDTRSSGGDTGMAVEGRNGSRSLENIAGIVTASAMQAENEVLSVILAICKNISSCPFKDLTPKDIEIKENRNRVENIVNSSNAYSVMKSSGMADQLALSKSRLSSDPITDTKINEQYQQQQLKLKLEQEKELQKIKSVQTLDKSNSLSNTNGTNSENTDV
jgi:SPP1 family phage portal protein